MALVHIHKVFVLDAYVHAETPEEVAYWASLMRGTLEDEYGVAVEANHPLVEEFTSSEIVKHTRIQRLDGGRYAQ